MGLWEAFSLWDSPSSTAWIVVGYFIAAFAVDIAFKGANFCNVYPIGQFLRSLPGVALQVDLL